jgi:hypothetical protein
MATHSKKAHMHADAGALGDARRLQPEERPLATLLADSAVPEEGSDINTLLDRSSDVRAGKQGLSSRHKWRRHRALTGRWNALIGSITMRFLRPVNRLSLVTQPPSLTDEDLVVDLHYFTCSGGC